MWHVLAIVNRRGNYFVMTVTRGNYTVLRRALRLCNVVSNVAYTVGTVSAAAAADSVLPRQRSQRSERRGNAQSHSDAD